MNHRDFLRSGSSALFGVSLPVTAGADPCIKKRISVKKSERKSTDSFHKPSEFWESTVQASCHTGGEPGGRGAVKKLSLPHEPDPVGTRCPASGLGFPVVDARQRVPTVEFFHGFRRSRSLATE